MNLESIFYFFLSFAFAFLGGYILFRGRRDLWVTLGVMALVVTADLLAVLVVGGSRGMDLFAAQEWTLLGIALLAGVLGMVLGRFQPGIAASVIGFIAGADVIMWLYDIVAYLFTDLANLSQQTTLIIGVVLIIIGGLLGIWVVRQARDEALILFTMIAGVILIQDALHLDKSSGLTAVIIVTLALAGVMVQYANYLRETKEIQPLDEPVMAESSMAYFQDLELGD